MKWRVRKSHLRGICRVPPSKSHTIRALLIATLADGHSTVRGALLEGDGASALQVARSLGANVDEQPQAITVSGIAGDHERGDSLLDCGNSGTSMRLFASAVALGSRERRFDGDSSLRTRLMRPLLAALEQLGAHYTIEGSRGDIPFSLRGPLRGGSASVSGVTSQFISSLLLSCPLAARDSILRVQGLNERPYVDVTRWWLDRMGMRYSVSPDYTEFSVVGGQHYRPIDVEIPGDFSSATFPAVAAALTGSVVAVSGLDFSDPQGDKGIFDILSGFGAVTTSSATGVTVAGGRGLCGREVDLNAMPDALPALAVLGTLASGITHLTNVPQARLKETDRISVMTSQLRAMGARIVEEKDGMVIECTGLRGAAVSGHGDHRIVMALALAGMAAEGETIVDTAEAASVTYPTFLADFRSLGANIEVVEE
jgi:3-phosphoshikimate 1-carboxyvinyltransferase